MDNSKERQICFRLTYYQISSDGYQVDSSLVQEVREFPTPTSIPDTRIFFDWRTN